jgi:uncharacterized protein (DUF2252 family)
MNDIEQQRAAGRAARRRFPRNAVGDWEPSADRDVMGVVHGVERGRTRNLIPIRRQRMAASPFTFFRGAAVVMARDLAARPNSGLAVQICGDAHVLNMGAYSSPEGHLVFDINDFDETTRAPFEWDLLRFATSLVLAGREAGDSDRNSAGAASAFVHSYRLSMAAFSRMPFLDLLHFNVNRIASAGPVDRVLRKAERATPAALMKKLTRKGNFRHEPPLLRRLSRAEAAKVIAALPDYERTLSPDRRFALGHYRPVDVAFRVSGTGSIGLRDFVVLLAGTSAGDDLFLQIKEESLSCYAPFAPSDTAHNGQRAAEGQRLVQRASDPLLGWTSIEGKDYLVRQLNDHKAGIEPEDLKGKSLMRYAVVAGTVLARGHARTGEAAAIRAYCGRTGRLDRAIGRFARAYADQTAADHALFVKACGAGG